jgi:hypothetical protein
MTVQPDTNTDKNNKPKIMTQPLPEILDQLETAVKEAQAAARESRQAADEAKRAGAEAAAQAQAAIPSALIRRILASWEFKIFVLIVLLATIVASMSMTLGVSLMGR